MRKNDENTCNGKMVVSVPVLEHKPRVLLWTDSNQFAGTEKHNCELERGLRDLGVPVRVGCPVPSPLSRAVSENGGSVLPMECKGLRSVSVILLLRRLLCSGEVQIVHAHNGRTALLGAVACLLAAGGVLVVSQHFIRPARTRRRGLMRWGSSCVHWWLSRRVNRWIAVSGAVRTGMLTRGDAPQALVSVVHNGVDPGDLNRKVDFGVLYRLTGLVSEGPVIVCVARLSEEKGHATLLHSLAILQAEGCLFRTWIVGDGELRGALEKQAATLELKEHVAFVGHQTDPEIWIEASDLLVLASPEEPFGLVLLEAMSRRKPVVAARAGGPCEIIEDQSSGLLFTPGDARDLALKLRVLLERESVRRLMGEAGFKRWRQQFSAESMSLETESVYQLAMEGLGVI